MGLFTNRPSTVDEAVSSLLKAVSDLNTVAADRYDAYTRKLDESSRLKTEAENDLAESSRATKVVAKLNAILED